MLLLHQATAGQLCLSHEKRNSETPIDRLLYALALFSERLIALRVPYNEHRKNKEVDKDVTVVINHVQSSLYLILEAVHLVLITFSFRYYDDASKLECVIQPEWRNIIPNSYLIEKSNNGEQDLDKNLKDMKEGAIIHQDELNLITLDNDKFTKNIIEDFVIGAVNFGLNNRIKDVVERMCVIVICILKASQRFYLTYQMKNNNDKDGKTAVLECDVMTTVLAPLFIVNLQGQDDVKEDGVCYNNQYGVLCTLLLLGKNTIYTSKAPPMKEEIKVDIGKNDPQQQEEITTSEEYDDDDEVFQDVTADSWLLNILNINLRSTLVKVLTRLIRTSKEVFTLFYHQQMALSRNCTLPSLSSSSKNFKEKLPLPPGVGDDRDDMKSTKPIPLLCEKLLEWANFMSSSAHCHHDVFKYFESMSHLNEYMIDATISTYNYDDMLHDIEIFRLRIFDLCVVLVATYRDCGARCLLGANITDSIGPSRSSSSKKERVKALYSFGEL